MKYCEKHNLKYMNHLDYCPVCIGEKMIDYSYPDAPDVHKKAIESYEKNRSDRE